MATKVRTALIEALRQRRVNVIQVPDQECYKSPLHFFVTGRNTNTYFNVVASNKDDNVTVHYYTVNKTGSVVLPKLIIKKPSAINTVADILTRENTP